MSHESGFRLGVYVDRNGASAAKPVAGSVFGPSPHRPRSLRLGTHFVAFYGASS